jgi:hypothetical protein
MRRIALNFVGGWRRWYLNPSPRSSPLFKGRGEEITIVLRRRNFTSGITRADLSFAN